MTIEEYTHLEPVVLRTIEDVRKHWLFLVKGFTKSGFRFADRAKPKEEVFLKFMFDVVDRGEPYGVAFLVRDKYTRRNVAFGVVNNAASPYRIKSALFHGFSNYEDEKALPFARRHAETWAKTNGYDEVLMISAKPNEFTKEKYEERWGYSQRFTVFGKVL